MESRNFTKAAALLMGVAVLLLSAARTAGVDVLPCDGIGVGATLPARLAHPFVHVSWLHAVVNVYVLWQLAFFFPLRMRHCLFAYSVACSCPTAVAMWDGGMSAIPDACAVGLSGMEYVLMGWVMPCVPSPKRFNFQLLLWTAASVLSGGVAVGLHLYCYLWGVSAAMLFRRR